MAGNSPDSNEHRSHDQRHRGPPIQVIIMDKKIIYNRKELKPKDDKAMLKYELEHSQYNFHFLLYIYIL